MMNWAEDIGVKEHCYLLLDEIQEVPGWEKAINNLLEAGKADIYITGSNSKLMSSEISTISDWTLYTNSRFLPYLIKSIWNLKKKVISQKQSCWKSIFALEDFRSLHLENMNRSRRIR